MNMALTPLFITIKIAAIATIITFFLGIFAARFVMRLSPKYKWLIDGLFTLPLVLPPTVIGFILLLTLGKNGFIGQILLKINIRIIFSVTGAVICATVVSFPLMYRTTRAALEQVNTDLIYAARTLGLSETEIFWKIIIPICMPSIGAGTVLSFARAIGEFGATLMVAGNIPNKTQTVSLLIYTAVSSGDMGLAMRWVIVIVAISLISITLINFLTDKNFTKKSN